jgi:hypothetical protein
MYNLICSSTIREKIENGVKIPPNVNGNYLKYLDKRWVMPISYKQFTNLIAGKNEFYKELVKRNGNNDPLKKTLIIIDEAHKLFAEDTPLAERPDISLLKKAIYKSYEVSKKDSCKLLLMTATPYTNDPIQLFKLLNLLRTDDYFPEVFEEFKDIYLDENYKFRKENNEHKIFLDKITGYISYLNREKDARQFAYPVIYNEEVLMSTSKNQLLFDMYNDFMKDIDEFIEVDVDKANELLLEFKDKLAEDKKSFDVKNKVLSQEEAMMECFKGDEKIDDDKAKNKLKEMKDYIKEMTKIIKEKRKVPKVKKVKKDDDLKIIDKTEDFIEEELFYQIDGFISKYENNKKIERIGIRVKKDEFTKFDEIGEKILNYGSSDISLIKNTKDKCIIQYDDIDFVITHKKDGDYVIYIITPSKEKNDVIRIIDNKEPNIEYEVYSQIINMISNNNYDQDVEKIGVRGKAKKFKDFKTIGERMINFGMDENAKITKNTKTECIIKINNLKISITYILNDEEVIYYLTPVISK